MSKDHTGSGDSLVQAGDKLLSKAMLTQISVAIWHHDRHVQTYFGAKFHAFVVKPHNFSTDCQD